MTRNTISPIIADIQAANSFNFEHVPDLSDRKAHAKGSADSPATSWPQRIVRRANIETVIYMIEPWERLLVQAVCVLFLASALHFTFGTTVNWLSFFE